ncbi:hypothetical protein CXG81DRAFT_24152 [Caulochytrium protostelioides]|uniref:SUN domain-containing protein n=2 Tax=Caulochytrium protostelioides TaxID=1555241 RepID=A0A4P9XDM2_9FUNG|nr:hypothetical protein CXG81DRAFT_24152 [Caulochytrium protostelioides]|eukprot:RKP03270.1 hypothetical protein CXG81DRAFT_24152 [Caulochytrium protostelioides]
MQTPGRPLRQRREGLDDRPTPFGGPATVLRNPPHAPTSMLLGDMPGHWPSPATAAAATAAKRTKSRLYTTTTTPYDLRDHDHDRNRDGNRGHDRYHDRNYDRNYDRDYDRDYDMDLDPMDEDSYDEKENLPIGGTPQIAFKKSLTQLKSILTTPRRFINGQERLEFPFSGDRHDRPDRHRYEDPHRSTSKGFASGFDRRDANVMQLPINSNTVVEFEYDRDLDDMPNIALAAGPNGFGPIPTPGMVRKTSRHTAQQRRQRAQQDGREGHGARDADADADAADAIMDGMRWPHGFNVVTEEETVYETGAPAPGDDDGATATADAAPPAGLLMRLVRAIGRGLLFRVLIPTVTRLMTILFAIVVLLLQLIFYGLLMLANMPYQLWCRRRRRRQEEARDADADAAGDATSPYDAEAETDDDDALYGRQSERTYRALKTWYFVRGVLLVGCGAFLLYLMATNRPIPRDDVAAPHGGGGSSSLPERPADPLLPRYATEAVSAAMQRQIQQLEDRLAELSQHEHQRASAETAHAAQRDRLLHDELTKLRAEFHDDMQKTAAGLASSPDVATLNKLIATQLRKFAKQQNEQWTRALPDQIERAVAAETAAWSARLAEMEQALQRQIHEQPTERLADALAETIGEITDRVGRQQQPALDAMRRELPDVVTERLMDAATSPLQRQLNDHLHAMEQTLAGTMASEIASAQSLALEHLRSQFAELKRDVEAATTAAAAAAATAAPLPAAGQEADLRLKVPERNYALATVGARVYLPLTSPTYSVPYRSSALQWWSAFTGARVIAGRPPSVALVPSVLPGQCWALSGRHGQLAVVLAIPAFPVAFTLSHISSHASLLGDEGLRAAPRGVELWAVWDPAAYAAIQAQDDDAASASASASSAASHRGSSLDDTADGEVLYRGDATPEDPAPVAMRLASGTFDPLNKPTQTFHLSSSVRQMLRHQLGQPVPIVLLRIQSNWGHEPWTCVYNLQVH